jgi:DNA-binding transcriptional LysR family regulator
MRNWDAVRAFLEVARTGSFRAAALGLKVSVNTLRRQIEEMEDDACITLFTRHASGARPTKEAERMLAAAKRMEMASYDLLRAQSVAADIRGEVRLSVTEVLGTVWLVPQMVEFQRQHPDLLIDLQCSMRPHDVMKMECDIALQLIPPECNDLRSLRIGRIHVMPFASQAYLARYGKPQSRDDFAGHRLVLQACDQLNSFGFERAFPGISQVGLVSLRTNSPMAHLRAVRCGAGIGALATFAGKFAGLEPVDLDWRDAADVWLIYHPDLAKTKRVRLVIDWLIEALSPRQHPWFSDDFIHPRDLPDDVAGLSLSRL